MKKDKIYLIALFIFFVVSALALNSCGKKNEEAAKDKPVQKEESTKPQSESSGNISGGDYMIEFTTEGLIKGKMKTFKIGDKFKQTMDAEIKGMKSKTDIFVKDKTVYTVTDIAGVKTGFKSDLDEFSKKKKTGENFTDFRDVEKYLEGKNPAGTEEVLGYKCDVYETAPGIFLSVNDKKYVLKIKGPEFSAIATAFDKNPKVSSAEMDIPTDVDFNGIDNINKNGMDKKKIDELIKKYKQQ